MCEPLALPEPFASVMAAGLGLPSPQSMEPVCVSLVPWSVNVAFTITGELMLTGARGAVMALRTGLTLASDRLASLVPTPPSSSVTVSVTLNVPSSLQLIDAFSAVGLVMLQFAPASADTTAYDQR